jgi:branched-chain amino acid transport system substrate-binding protein
LPTTDLGALTYDAVRLIAHALKRAKSLDSQGVTEAIAETRRFAAVTGNMSFEGRRGNPTKKPIIVEIRPTGKVYIKEYTTKEIQKVLE